jgi:3-hydroxyisobutyrate dehydrogenase
VIVARVGFIGLGDIGAPMAEHVARAFDTVLWNRSAVRARALAEATGATAAPSPPWLVEQVDAVILCLPTSEIVHEVVKSVGQAWRPGQLVVDATSGDPFLSRAIAGELAERRVGFVDAPVSGGTDGARAARLTVMLGGKEPWIARARELVAPYAGSIRHVGPVGAAHALKAVNNALLAVHIQAAGEGLAALVKFGVDAGVALDVINASSGRSFVSQELFPQRVLTRAWPRTFRLALLDKDLGVALRVMEETGTPRDAIRTAKEAFAAARGALGEEADHVELVKEIERRGGVEIAGDR